MRLTPEIFLSIILLAIASPSFAQTIPVGTPLVEEVSRRLQIEGERDSITSFTIRPIQNSLNSTEDTDNHLSNVFIRRANQHNLFLSKDSGKVQQLPITIKNQYNTHHPYGWNDGSMIPARGYQSQLSFGMFAKLGLLSIQINPEILYAQNQNFSTFPVSHSDSIWKSYYHILNHIDNPEKYGNKSYLKLFPGQSSIRFNYKELSIGVSTENLWWGPGIRNSIVMSNNAPGYKHITFNSTSPVMSPIGSFEWQIISGVLKNSDILPADTSRQFEGQNLYYPKVDDDRYLNGMVLTWQPKWTKGLFLGMSRVFYLYEDDLQRSLNSYLPTISKFFKGGNVQREDSIRRDQMISLFFRLVLPKEKAELYAEFGKNDHASNLRDFMLEPEHARAYIIGARKIFFTNKMTKVELFTEIANFQSPSTVRLRDQPSWYAHHQVKHGYTNRGQVIGAGIGPGSNSQTLGINWIKGIEKFGLTFERIARNNDFYYDAFTPTRSFNRHWVDLSVNLNKSWVRKHFMYNANLSFVRSLNYQWRKGAGKDVSNLHAGLSVSYLF